LIIKLLKKLQKWGGQVRRKGKWAFSNLVSFCKIQLFNFIQLIKFSENKKKTGYLMPYPMNNCPCLVSLFTQKQEIQKLNHCISTL
jgi:hypothetical protein